MVLLEPPHMRVTLFSVALYCVIGPEMSLAFESESTDKQSTAVKTSYCGLHCVFAVARISQPEAEFETILQRQFVNGPFGSTPQNLVDAFATYGIKSAPAAGLAIDQLRQLNGPALLLVRPVGRRAYSHWVLFLGFEGDHVRIYDPPKDKINISMTDLLAIWDGHAVIPDLPGDSEASSPSSWLAPFRLPFSVLFVIALACGLLLVFRNKPSIACLSATGSVILATHVVSETGFVHGNYGIGTIQASYFRHQLPELNYSSVRKLMADSRVVLIDARTTNAFDRFHLPDAVNIPVNSTYGQLIRAVRDLDSSDRIVVYCQSEGCLWADSVANLISNFGFADVSVYRGGVLDWVEHHDE